MLLRYVDIAKGTRYVLRLYNNSGNLNRIVFEHEVLFLLSAENKFPFKIPTPYLSTSRTVFVQLTPELYATLWEVIEGSLPKLRLVEEIGAASGLLSDALVKLTDKIDPTKCPTPPYYDLYAVHHAVNRY